MVVLWMSILAMEAQENHILHTVTKGQSLYSISKMYGVSEEDIVALNPGCDEVIRVGQELKIPGTQRFHTIKQGETLYRLTVTYGLTAKEICAANPGLSAENFRVGQVIVIPQKNAEGAVMTVAVAEEPKTTTSSAAVTTAKAADETPAATNDEHNAEQTVRQAVRSVSVDDLVSLAEDRTMCKTTHKVKKRETIYSLIRKYDITADDLFAANPRLRETGLQKGMELCIPYPMDELADIRRERAAERATTVTDEQAETESSFFSDDELFEQAQTVVMPYNSIRAAVLLPFMLSDSTSADRAKMVEFYEGVLLAVDSLKHQGVSTELFVYDTGGKNASIRSILEREEMAAVNIIFGPLHPKHITEASAFAQEHKIPLVLPFARSVDEVFSNPYIFQVNTPQSYFYSDVFDHFFRCFPRPNVLFFHSSEEKEDPFSVALRGELTNRGFEYSVLEADTTSNVAHFYELCKPKDNNIIMLTSSTNGVLNNMMPVFQLMVRDTVSHNYDLHLFGYPEYQVYTSNHLASFYEADTYFYSSFYANNLLPDSKNFHSLFRHTYCDEIANRFPKYAILGFDMAFYLLRALDEFGSNMADRLSELPYNSIQTGFKFERVNNWGGFINRKAYFIHLSKDFTIEKIDFDR